jgi:CheY-like chemotaxis protein
MKDLEQYFSNAIPDEERLHNMRSFSHGAWLGIQCFLDRIDSYYDLLQLELEDNPAGLAYLKQSQMAFEQAQNLVACMRDTGDDDSWKESFDLLILLQGIANRLSQITGPDMSVTALQLPDDQAFVKGRQFLLQEVLFEIPKLLQAMDETTITCSVQHRELDEFFLESRKISLSPGSYYVCSFTNTAEPNLEQATPLMEKVFSTSSLRINQRLVFVSGILLEHGGEFLVTQCGDTLVGVHMLIPAQASESHMFNNDDLHEDHLKGIETILLVDDEGSIWDVVIDMLKNLGYTVVLAENGADCVEIYEANQGGIDLVLLDMVMPQMNGHEAFFKLRDIDPDVKVLLQSGYIQQKEAQDVLKHGALGFLQKPYRMKELAAKIRQIFN